MSFEAELSMTRTIGWILGLVAFAAVIYAFSTSEISTDTHQVKVETVEKKVFVPLLSSRVEIVKSKPEIIVKTTQIKPRVNKYIKPKWLVRHKHNSPVVAEKSRPEDSMEGFEYVGGKQVEDVVYEKKVLPKGFVPAGVSKDGKRVLLWNEETGEVGVD